MAIQKIFLSLFVFSSFVFTCLLFGVVGPFFIFFEVVFRSVPVGRVIRHLIRLYGCFLVRLTSLLIPVEVENRAGDLPLPVVFVANHCSAIDPYLFGLIACENAFVTSWPFMIPIHSLLMRMAEYVDARGGWVEIESQGKALLDKGCSVTVWPEGHRSRDGKLRRFRKGAFKLAAAAHRPVVPVCIFGSGEILPPGHRLFRPGRIRIIVLPPVFPSQEDDLEVRVTGLKDEAHQRIADELKLRSGKS